MYIFKTLTEEEKEDMIVDTLRNNERDLYAHTVTKERVDAIIPTMPAQITKVNDDGSEELVVNPQIIHYKKKIAEVTGRIVEVQAIIDKTLPQIAKEKIPVVLARIKAKEALTTK